MIHAQVRLPLVTLWLQDKHKKNYIVSQCNNIMKVKTTWKMSYNKVKLTYLFSVL